MRTLVDSPTEQDEHQSRETLNPHILVKVSDL